MGEKSQIASLGIFLWIRAHTSTSSGWEQVTGGLSTTLKRQVSPPAVSMLRAYCYLPLFGRLRLLQITDL